VVRYPWHVSRLLAAPNDSVSTPPVPLTAANLNLQLMQQEPPQSCPTSIANNTSVLVNPMDQNKASRFNIRYPQPKYK
jgi:hypothetical protein